MFVADDLDHLLDSAFEVGDFPHVEVDVAGVPHRFAWAGHGGAPDLDRIGQDLTDIAQAAVALFEGDHPIDAYTFLCVGWDEGGGGLEHRDGSVLMMPVTTFQDEDTYARFQTLLAHEYLHLWNVKRLVPADLVRPDPVAHTHTRLLWVAEGWTAYYDELLPLRAGRWTTDRYLTAMGEQLDRVLERPGTALQSVEEASHHAWTKLYVRDENSDNAGTNYYDHGAVLAWCLDLLIRRERPDGDGLDEAFRSLWRQFGASGRGYTDADVRAAVSARPPGPTSGRSSTPTWRGAPCPTSTRWWAPSGLAIERPDPDPATPYLGATPADDDQGVVLTTVRRGGPAWRAGVTGGDRLVAVDGQVVRRGQLPTVLRSRAPGDEVELHVTRGPAQPAPAGDARATPSARVACAPWPTRPNSSRPPSAAGPDTTCRSATAPADPSPAPPRPRSRMTVLLVFAAVLLGAVLLSDLAQRSVLSTAVLFLAAGFVLGPSLVGVLPAGGADEDLVRRLAELALFAVLLTDGARVGARQLVSAWGLPGRALLLGMPLVFVLTALAAWGIAGLGWVEAALLGAVLAPTDPVFASAIVGREEVPARLRHLLNVESGINDGLALPVVLVLLSVLGGESTTVDGAGRRAGRRPGHRRRRRTGRGPPRGLTLAGGRGRAPGPAGGLGGHARVRALPDLPPQPVPRGVRRRDHPGNGRPAAHGRVPRPRGDGLRAVEAGRAAGVRGVDLADVPRGDLTQRVRVRGSWRCCSSDRWRCRWRCCAAS